MTPADRAAAQRRVNQILAFRDECAALRAEGRLALAERDLRAIERYHEALLARLTAEFDVDASREAGRLSFGMRVAASVGGAALVAAAVALVVRSWWQLDVVGQVALLAALPVGALAATELSARRDRTGHMARLFALAACGVTWLAIFGTARAVGVDAGPPVLWLGALATLALAAARGSRLVGGIAVAAIIAAMSATASWAGGADWRAGFARLEPLGVAALAVLVASRLLDQPGPGFAAVARGVSLSVTLGVLLLLSTWADLSQLALPATVVEGGYQVLFALVALAALGTGVARGRREVSVPAGVALTVFLLIRLFDWFWRALPAWAFFLMIAGLAFGWIAVLRRVRTRLAGSSW